jgi:hypothetical protein
MSSSKRIGHTATQPDPRNLAGWEAAIQEFLHQAVHLEARGAHRAAVTLYDAIRIARLGGLPCQEHNHPTQPEPVEG